MRSKVVSDRSECKLMGQQRSEDSGRLWLSLLGLGFLVCTVDWRVPGGLAALASLVFMNRPYSARRRGGGPGKEGEEEVS